MVDPLSKQESDFLQISFLLDEAERLLEIDSVVDEDDDGHDGDDENTTQTTKVEAMEEDFVRNAIHSARTKTENEFGIEL